MNYMKIDECDVLNGEGMRVSLFVSGCTLNCEGCFNKDAQNFKAGQLFTTDTLNKILKYLARDTISGLSILGGDPLHPKNMKEILNIVDQVKSMYPTKSIWMWTGYTHEELKIRTDIDAELTNKILNQINILIDGPFIKQLKTTNTLWRGSSNQKFIVLNDIRSKIN